MLFVGLLVVLALLYLKIHLTPPRPVIVPQLPDPLWHERDNIVETLHQLERESAVRDHLNKSAERHHVRTLLDILGPPDALPMTPAELLRHAQLRRGYVAPTAFVLQPSLDTTEASSGVVFKSDEPQWLTDYQGQPHITSVLDLHLRALGPSELILPHKLLTGLPGFGKTLLAKIITNELQQRARRLGLPTIGFVETYAANLNSVSAMDAVVEQLQQHAACVWFIDELHVINELIATKLYLLMEEGRYPFDGSLNPTPLPPIMVIGATTDYGLLHPALKRRFGEALMMRPLSRDALHHMAGSLLPSATDDAIALLVDRCASSGAPHELKTLAKDATTYAKAHGLRVVTADTMHAVFNTWEIDTQGLRAVDRRVLTTLYQRPKYRAKDGALLGYGASEADICAMSGLDPGEFRAVIRPRLMARGYIEVRSGFGLRLTDLAVQDYPKAVVCA